MSQPLSEILTWDDEQWEVFVHDWLIVCKSDDYPWSERLGGAGDKGRDVVGYKSDPNVEGYSWDNYQCKLYKKSLGFSDVVVEFGKLIYFTLNGDYPIPQKYFFVAPYDLSTTFSNLLKNKNELKKAVLDSWDSAISKKISKKINIPLDDEIKKYIESFDFSIFYSLPLSLILNDIASTHLYFKYFNELYAVRIPPNEIPTYDSKKESVYVNALLQAYSEHGNKTYSSFLELDDPYRRHFNNSRNDFYFASSLEVFVREVFKDDVFKALKCYISSSIEPVFYEDHNYSFIRCNAVLKQAVLTPIAHSVLSKICEANDKKGICHHLVNDGEVIWTVR